MPWEEKTKVSLRSEFVFYARQEGANVAELSRRYGISRSTAYKWIGRSKEGDTVSLEDRSRRPHRSPCTTPEPMVAKVLEQRAKHPKWGGRKLRRRLLDLDEENVPAASTITEILRRNGLLAPEDSEQRQALTRFEYEVPNGLWQMDFKGHFPLTRSPERCHPLTIIDDHSRFALAIEACANERSETVQRRLERTFRTYGIPERLLTDNGAPWWAPRGGGITRLSRWLIQIGIQMVRCRPRHPQTQGKEERFNRTLKAEVISENPLRSITHSQQAFDDWRYVYNFERPHEALDLDVPASRYEPSSRPYPNRMPVFEYGSGDQVRKVQATGDISYQCRKIQVGKGLKDCYVAVRPTMEDGVVDVYYLRQRIVSVTLDDCYRQYKPKPKV